MKTLDLKLNPGEEVKLIVRPYWISQFGHMFFLVLLFSIPFFFVIPLFRYGTMGIGIFVFFLTIVFILGIRWLYIWYNTLFIISNLRLIDVDQQGFFHQTVSEATLKKVQDVTYSKKGMIQTIFRYGNLEIQTAGNSLTLEIHGVKNPDAVQALVNELREDNFKEDKDILDSDEYTIDIDDMDFGELLDNEIREIFDKIKSDVGSKRFYNILKKYRKKKRDSE